jgi:hypothetical protein
MPADVAKLSLADHRNNGLPDECFRKYILRVIGV